MNAFQRGASHQRGIARHTEHCGAFHHQKRTQPLAAIEARIAHRLHQPVRAHDFA